MIEETLSAISMVSDPDGPGLVSRESMPLAEAQRLEQSLRAAGREVSYARDNDDHTRAWLYVAAP